MDKEQINVLIKLFYLIICADGEVNYRELAMGKKVAQEHGMDEDSFNEELVRLKSLPAGQVHGQCLEKLKKLNREAQAECMAWTVSLASADGYIANKERKFIHDLFEKELQISYSEITEKWKTIMGKLGISMH